MVSETSADPVCRICAARLVRPFSAREMMFGFRDRFTYAECPDCGAVQICDPPLDLSRYYPDNYYAFQTTARSGLRRRLRRAKHRLLLGSRSPVARLLAKVKPHLAVAWLRRTHTAPSASVLDVGCGSGHLLRDLHDAGFRDLVGVDAFIDASSAPAPGLRIVKGTLQDIDRRFHLIMFHHSLEHVDDQVGVLSRAAELLEPDGWCIVRVPIVSSWAWREYREHWVQLDAPRHFVLHSTDSMRRLGERAGLALRATEFDSNELQFEGSELYRRDVPLHHGGPPLSRRRRRELRRRAARLNARGEGDQAAFYFQRVGA